ncbi:phosphopantothenoylcysteine decarboxylase domain-containing protein [Halosquirtibacter xylanolyticus]|uniref:phosphopantothenoylcysteine decarboxylase domain-containing protein n=1 Tax=Halosquirtibacter xylanolyticus TaxID=3374599 RepID=UPI003747DE49
MLTAGPTHEKIDPVRFIGNYSSGKMGYAIAEELAERGAEVTLISGPTQLHVTHPSIHKISVESAKEMYAASMEHFDTMDAAIMAAAVADYAPENYASQKLKRDGEDLILRLVPNPDIAASLGAIKEKQILVGFALETQHAEANARKKIEKKNLDFVVLNSLENKGAGFQTDTNIISILHRNGEQQDYPLKSKRAVAVDIVDYLEKSL